MPATVRPGGERDPNKSWTARNYFGHGGDTRYLMVSLDPDYVTNEQLCAILGLAAGTVRDLISGRRGREEPIGTKIGNTWLVHKQDALAIIERYWKL